MKRTALGLVIALLSGCVIGAPPGFSSGKRWSVPIVNPLEDGQILVPVTINKQGPYLFLVDPDSPVSSIDNAIVSKLKLYNGYGGQALAEGDYMVQVFGAEVRTIGVGNLTVSNRTLRVHKVGTYWVNDRQVRGVLGRDVLAQSLILAIDRDRGVMEIAVQGQIQPPPNAKKIGYYYEQGQRLRVTSRMVAKGLVNRSMKVRVHLDLGSPVSALWVKKLRKGNLPRFAHQMTLVDDLGTKRDVDHASMAAWFKVGEAEASGVKLVPYGDKRWRETDLDGIAGQSFFASFNVIANWHEQKFYLTPRENDSNASAPLRLQRWSSAFDRCHNPGCVEIELSSKGLLVTRDAAAPSRAYEVILQAVDSAGSPVNMPLLRAVMPEGFPIVHEPMMDPGYRKAAGFRVLDVSPFPPRCRAASTTPRCIRQMTTR